MGTYDRTTKLLERRLRQGREPFSPFPLFPHQHTIYCAAPPGIKPPANPKTPIIMTTDMQVPLRYLLIRTWANRAFSKKHHQGEKLENRRSYHNAAECQQQGEDHET